MANGKPTISERARQRICPECGGEVTRRSPKGPFPTFCSPEHKRAHANRHTVEGRALIGFLKAWRIDRGTGEIAQKSFAQVCQILDLFNAQDAELKRPRADLYAAKVLAEGTMFFDRQRPRKGAGTASKGA